MTFKRMWDMMHFYFFNVFIFVGIPVFLVNLYFGRCELRDIPEGYEPRHWEYENHPIKQLQVRYGFGSHQRKHEKDMGMFHQCTQRLQWRLQEERIHHLMYERQDYKAWYYIPYQSKWLEYSHQLADKLSSNREPFHEMQLT